MANIVAVLILVVSMDRLVSPNYVKLYTDNIVTIDATNTSHSASSTECAISCRINHPCVSYAYHPGRTQCYLYDRVLHLKDATNDDEGIQIFTSEFGNDNIALNKPTFQSSTRGGRESYFGVDGDRTSEFSTKKTAWWCMDLMAVREMKWLILYNSITSTAHKSRVVGFEIWFAASGECTQTGFDTSTLCYKDTSSTALNIYTINSCSQPNTQFDARFVFIYHPTNFLHLNEVEIVPWGCRT